MRKLKLQVQITIDGFIAGEHGEMDWLCYPWSNDISHYVKEITESIDTILLGRKLAEGFIPHWKSVSENPHDPEYEGGVKFSETKKIVFTKTIQNSLWDNTSIANGDLEEEISNLKQLTGMDMIVYGGGSFVSSLIKSRLIDEFYLFVNPTAIGRGMSIFQSINQNQNMKLRAMKQFECGVGLMHYELNM